MTLFRAIKAVFIAIPMLLALTAGANATLVHFVGDLDFVVNDQGGAIYSGVPTGTQFSGTLDSNTATGFITDGVTNTAIGCCIAAGGLGVDDNFVVGVNEANVLNALLGAGSFNPGDMIDVVDLEGDSPTANGGRIEVGVSFLFDASTFPGALPLSIQFVAQNAQAALFFITEFDASQNEIYSGVGLVESGAIPAPPALVLMATGLALTVAGRYISRRRQQRP